MSRAAPVLILLVSLAGPVRALETPQEILACMAGNEPAGSTTQTLVLSSVDRSGTETTSRAMLYWRREAQRSDLVVRFLEPPEMKGAALLIREGAAGEKADLYLYLPELGETRRVSGRVSQGPLFGTTFSFEDFERLYGIAHYGELERHADTEADGRPVYVLEGQPAPEDDSSYERVVFHVDRETCIPLRMDLFEAADRLRKRMVLDPDAFLVRGSHHVPGSVHLEDLRQRTSSRLLVEDVTLDARIPVGIFLPEQLGGSDGSP